MRLVKTAISNGIFRVRNSANHETSGGLAVGAGDANNSEVASRVMIFNASEYSLRVVIGKNGLVVKGEFF